MRLLVRRSQAEGKLLGGHKGFVIAFRVELTAPEQELVRRYKTEDEIVAVVPNRDRPDQPELLTVRDLLAGRSFTRKAVTDLLETEEEVKHGCENLKVLLAVMETFGGEEVFEF